MPQTASPVPVRPVRPVNCRGKGPREQRQAERAALAARLRKTSTLKSSPPAMSGATRPWRHAIHRQQWRLGPGWWRETPALRVATASSRLRWTRSGRTDPRGARPDLEHPCPNRVTSARRIERLLDQEGRGAPERLPRHGNGRSPTRYPVTLAFRNISVNRPTTASSWLRLTHTVAAVANGAAPVDISSYLPHPGFQDAGLALRIFRKL